MRFFFYGTLLDAEVRRLVLGAHAAALPAEPATLAGFRRCRVRRRAYPAVTPRPGATVAGQLIRGVDAAMADRIFAFEGEEYDPVLCDIAGADGRKRPAWVFVANDRAVLSPQSWDIGEWQRRHKAAFLRRLRRGLV